MSDKCRQVVRAAREWPHRLADDPRLNSDGSPLTGSEAWDFLHNLFVRCHACNGAAVAGEDCDCGGTGFDWSDTADARATLRALAAATAPGMVQPVECDGSPHCSATRHVHGCYADTGNCDDPSDHVPGLVLTADDAETVVSAIGAARSALICREPISAKLDATFDAALALLARTSETP